MINLKDYVDFVTSLTEMDEVKSGSFKLPKYIVFNLGLENHKNLHKEVIMAKNGFVDDDKLIEPFEINVFGITLKFENE